MANGRKILVIDDDYNFLEYARIVLESEGYQVYTADNGNEGLLAIQKLKPDLVMLDIMISYSFDGLNVTKEICEDPELRKIPLIMVSAIVDKEDMERSAKDKFTYSCFMSKPILPHELVTTIKEFMN